MAKTMPTAPPNPLGFCSLLGVSGTDLLAALDSGELATVEIIVRRFVLDALRSWTEPGPDRQTAGRLPTPSSGADVLRKAAAAAKLAGNLQRALASLVGASPGLRRRADLARGAAAQALRQAIASGLRQREYQTLVPVTGDDYVQLLRDVPDELDAFAFAFGDEMRLFRSLVDWHSRVVPGGKLTPKQLDGFWVCGGCTLVYRPAHRDGRYCSECANAEPRPNLGKYSPAVFTGGGLRLVVRAPDRRTVVTHRCSVCNGFLFGTKRRDTHDGCRRRKARAAQASHGTTVGQ